MIKAIRCHASATLRSAPVVLPICLLAESLNGCTLATSPRDTYTGIVLVCTSGFMPLAVWILYPTSGKRRPYAERSSQKKRRGFPRLH